MNKVDCNRKVPLEKRSIYVYSNEIMSVTYQPKKKKRVKTHGFLVRSATTSGRKTLTRRRQKGRKKITV